MIKLSEREAQLIDLLDGPDYHIDRDTIIRGQNKCDHTTSYQPQFEASQVEFVLTFQGKNDRGTEFSANLKLACISKLTNWFHFKIGAKCDYPEMAKEGDWSAIRDSQPHTIDRIFNEDVLTLLE